MENKQLTGKRKSSNGETAEKAKKISVQMRDYLIGHSKNRPLQEETNRICKNHKKEKDQFPRNGKH